MQEYEMFRFGSDFALYTMVIGFGIIVLLILLYVFYFINKQKSLKKLATVEALKHLVSNTSLVKQVVKASLILLSFVLLILTLMGPQGDPEEITEKSMGRNIAVLLDVSKSMLADDLKPNRLEFAKMSIRDLVSALKGDNIALMVFSGNSAIKSPLTTQYFNFLSSLDSVSFEDVTRGGTNLGQAILDAKDKIFTDKDNKNNDIILITDGEDTEGSQPVEAAKIAAKDKIRIHTIGIGDPDSGRKIPLKKSDGSSSNYVQYKGQEIRSKLDEKTLREIADVTSQGSIDAERAVYVPVKTGALDLKGIYEKVISSAEKSEIKSKKTPRYKEWYQGFLLIALILILIEAIIPDRKRVLIQLLSSSIKRFKKVKKISMIILIILFFTILSGCSSQNGSDTVISGNNSYKSENYKNAIELYETAQKEIPDAGEIEFNLGDAYFKNNEISKAVEHFEKAIDKGTRTIQKKSNYNLGNVSIVDAQNQMNSDSKKALEKIREGLSYYQKVLDMNEADSKVHSLSDEDIQVNEDTKHNIASARLFLKNMLDKIKQQQEQNKGNQDKLKELAEKLKKLIETQEGINTKTKNVIENKEQASNKNHTELKQNQAENLKGTNEFSKEFNELTAQSGTNTSQQQSQTLPPENVQKVNEAINNALVEEGIASKHLNNTRLKDAVNPEEKALEQLIEALKNMVNPQEQKQDQQQQQQQQQQQEQKKDDEQKDKDKKDQQQQQQQQKMNPDEAKKELEKLKSQSKKKEKDLEDEWKKQHQVPLQYEPVDKDW